MTYQATRLKSVLGHIRRINTLIISRTLRQRASFARLDRHLLALLAQSLSCGLDFSNCTVGKWVIEIQMVGVVFVVDITEPVTPSEQGKD